MTIKIKKNLNGSILDIGGGGEAVIGQIYKDRVIAIDNQQEELDEAPECCSKKLMDATDLVFPDNSFDNVTFFYSLMYMEQEEQYKSICEAVRVLKIGGLMNIWDCDICFAYPDPFLVELDIETDNKAIHTTYGIIKKAPQSSDSIINLLEHAGLRIDTIKKEDGQFYVQCKKE